MPTNLTIQTLLGDVVGSTGHRYAVTDNAGNTTDTVKIITNRAGGYLGVYHTGSKVNLASSTDLVNWVFRRTLDPQATQPTMCALSTGGFLTATEFTTWPGPVACSGSGTTRTCRRCWPARSTVSGRSPDRCRGSEGTPNIYSVSLTPDIDHSIIDVGFHYQRNCDVDRQARGRLINLTTWTAASRPRRGRPAHRGRGRPGPGRQREHRDRDTAVFDNTRYTLHEVQNIEQISVSDRREPALRRSAGPGAQSGDTPFFGIGIGS